MSRLHAEGGFTFVEQLIVMALLVAVLGATLITFERSEVKREEVQSQNDSQQKARVAISAAARELRNLASPTTQQPRAVERKGDYEVVFETVATQKIAGSANPRNLQRVRYCLGPEVNGKATLFRQSQPLANASVPGPLPSGSCPDTGWSGDASAIADDIVNRSKALPVFAFNATDLESVTAIAVELLVDENTARRPLATKLGSRVFLRNQNRAPVAAFTWAPKAGGGAVVLNGSPSDDPEATTLKKFEWFADGNLVTPVATGVVVSWSPPNSQPHSVTLRVTDSGDRTGETTQTGVSSG